MEIDEMIDLCYLSSVALQGHESTGSEPAARREDAHKYEAMSATLVVAEAYLWAFLFLRKRRIGFDR
jgi:hypothetical protein